jgi:hypothetical protein
MSQLAVSTVRSLVTAQLTVLLAGLGKARWCELATASPGAAEAFLQVFPQAGFVCVHRHCLDVVRAGVEARPWGLQGQGLAPYLVAYPGNSVAALAAYWADSTEELLAFEEANHEIAIRVRYEDVVANPAGALTAVRARLGLEDPGPSTFPEQPAPLEAKVRAPLASDDVVPVEMIPSPLRERISRMHTELGHPSLK